MSRRNFCHFILSLLNVLINNMGNIKKAEPDLKLWTSRPPHMGSKIQKNQSGYTLANSGRGCGRGLISNLFFLKIPHLLHRPTTATFAGKNRRYMALQSSQQKSDSTLQSLLFKLLFLFLPGSPKTSLDMSKLDLHIIWFISNFFLQI